MIIPDMRRDVFHDPRAGLAKPRDYIGRRRFDQVHLPGQQRIGPRDGFRRADQHNAIHLRHARGIPIAGVAQQFDTRARHQPTHAERARARRFICKAFPGPAKLFILCGRGNQEPQHLIGEDAVHGFGGDFHRHGVNLAPRCNGRQARAHLRRLAIVKMRRLLIEHFLEIPDHRIGIEIRPVMEFHAWPQPKNPALTIRPIGLPGCRKTRHELPGPVRHIHFPGNQRVIQRIAGELISARAAIRLAGGLRDIGHGNAVA